MTKLVKRLLIATALLFSLGILIPMLTLAFFSGNVANAKSSGILDGTVVLKDKYQDKVNETKKKKEEAAARKNQLDAEIKQLQREADDIHIGNRG